MQGSRLTSETSLTPAERNLLHLTVQGQSPAQTAAVLGVSVLEAQAALRELQSRVGVSSRRALIVRAILLDWVDPLIE